MVLDLASWVKLGAVGFVANSFEIPPRTSEVVRPMMVVKMAAWATAKAAIAAITGGIAG
jgi:hypothetical protein